MSQILYFSRYNRDENKDGGRRRTAQLFQVLSKKIDFDFISQLDFSKEQLKTAIPKKRLFKPSKESQIASCMEQNYTSMVYTRAKAARLFIEKITKKTKIVFIDDPLYYEPLVDFCNKEKIAVIALVQNIESLVTGQVKPARKKDLFCREIEILQKCNAAIAISKEEHLLLSNFDIVTFYLPYLPIESIKERLLKIRKEREHIPKEGLALLGTMLNEPTCRGVLNFVEKYIGNDFAEQYGKIYIGGFGADKIKDDITNPNVIIRNDLSNQEHDDLLKTVKACVCYQDQGGGALTKIPEYLIAGIPVLSNTIAARNYYDIEGVVLFDTIKEFYDAGKKIKRFDNNVIAIPEFRYDSNSFFIFVRSLL